jgi:DNA modification methylase
VICNGMAEKTPHATQKPEALIEKLILASSAPGQLVVDPFVGSGTTAVVAARLGRSWIAGDGDPRFVGLARERLVAQQAGPERAAGRRSRGRARRATAEAGGPSP